VRAPIYHFDYHADGAHPYVVKLSWKSIVFANGCFDMFHPGHLHLLTEASLQAQEDDSILVVGVNSDRSVRAIKGESRPIWCERDRAQAVASLRFVDYVVVFEEQTPWELMNVLMPRLVVKGDEYREKNVVVSTDCKVHYARTLPGWSTTAMIERIRGS
jgi:rfaE bifunctional protein nucleotidyltransferase chain/domain